MGIITKIGDAGFTHSLAGNKVSKASALIDAGGTLDELNAQISDFKISLLNEIPSSHLEEISKFLLWILHVNTHISKNISIYKNNKKSIDLNLNIVSTIEKQILEYEKNNKTYPQFVICSSNTLSSRANILRTISRRAERSFIKFKEENNIDDLNHTLVFLNRLSDYFFILSRHLDDSQYVLYDKNLIEE